jgi:release factor glutamine methyltransferase
VTVDEALAQAVSRLGHSGVGTPGLDAELLLRHILGWDRARILADSDAALPPAAEHAFLALVEERARRRPLQHLLGTQSFWRREFGVGPGVLIPRPETEILVEAALDLVQRIFRPVIVDVGTGSGCIALSLAGERPDAEVHAVDHSAPALAIAMDNARRLGLRGRVSFHEGDLLGPVASLAGRIDLVACNPPYVDPSEAADLPPEVRDHEPAVALFPPGDRYDLYRRLAPQALGLLRPQGLLVVEIGQGMESEVARIFREAGLVVLKVLPDLQSIPRVLVAVPAAAPAEARS